MERGVSRGGEVARGVAEMGCGECGGGGGGRGDASECESGGATVHLHALRRGMIR